MMTQSTRRMTSANSLGVLWDPQIHGVQCGEGVARSFEDLELERGVDIAQKQVGGHPARFRAIWDGTARTR